MEIFRKFACKNCTFFTRTPRFQTRLTPLFVAIYWRLINAQQSLPCLTMASQILAVLREVAQLFRQHHCSVFRLGVFQLSANYYSGICCLLSDAIRRLSRILRGFQHCLVQRKQYLDNIIFNIGLYIYIRVSQNTGKK